MWDGRKGVINLNNSGFWNWEISDVATTLKVQGVSSADLYQPTDHYINP